LRRGGLAAAARVRRLDGEGLVQAVLAGADRGADRALVAVDRQVLAGGDAVRGYAQVDQAVGRGRQRGRRGAGGRGRRGGRAGGGGGGGGREAPAAVPGGGRALALAPPLAAALPAPAAAAVPAAALFLAAAAEQPDDATFGGDLRLLDLRVVEGHLERLA